MEYYAAAGHQLQGAREAIHLSLAEVLSQEEADPNSTVDARRMMTNLRRMTADEGDDRSLLDVGCGYGFYAREAQRTGFSVVALEMASEEREIARAMTGLDPLDCPFEELAWDGPRFSAVLMSHILEHALDVHAWVEQARGLLGTGGILAISLPSFDSVFRHILQERDPFICPPTHLNFFTAASLSALLRAHDFSIERQEWVSRIPRRAIVRRIPVLRTALAPLACGTARLALSACNALHLGMSLHVYGRKR
jgi:SAM-dependent methyltransferase